ncbi:hypothetical protein, partial [uncultured Megasphaera sp.]|uniref:hypothetical protein n=1 Tax=uncultured Megasphaera sp. TaxID=165188 RepID=UPI00259763DE
SALRRLVYLSKPLAVCQALSFEKIRDAYAVSSESLFILPHIFFPVKTAFSLPPCRLFRKIKAA